MNLSQKTRLAKVAGVLSLAALPLILGGWEGSSIPWPDLAAPNLPSWFAGCNHLRIDESGVVPSPMPGCIQPEFSFNVDPVCSGIPNFFTVDGKVYDSLWQTSIDFEQLLGNVQPNAATNPVVQVRPDNPDIVVLFFGYAPPANTKTAPRAYFVALDRKKLSEQFRLPYDGDPLAASKRLNKSLIASWPLVIDEEANRDCGSIHLAGAAENPAYPNAVTAFVATCKHAYGFRLQFETDGTLSRLDRFYEETRGDAKPNTEHRAEMVVVPAGNGYLLVWPYENNDDQTMLSSTLLDAKGEMLTHVDKPLGLTRFITGMNIDRTRKTIYITTPQEPNKLLAYGLLDDAHQWNKSDLHRTYDNLPGVGWSQIEIGPNGQPYMLTSQHVIVGFADEASPPDFSPTELAGAISLIQDSEPSIRPLATNVRGEAAFCPISTSADADFSGTFATCTQCLSIEGAYTHQCIYEWNQCHDDATCAKLFARDLNDQAWGTDKVCNLRRYLDDPGNAQVLHDEGIQRFLALEDCVKCYECGNCVEASSYCIALADLETVACSP